MAENEMVESHHRFRGPGFEPASGVGDGQGMLQSMSSHRVGQGVGD